MTGMGGGYIHSGDNTCRTPRYCLRSGCAEFTLRHKDLQCFVWPVAQGKLFTAVLVFFEGIYSVISRPCCCCPYLEQSAPTCHVRTLYVCFLRSPQVFPIQAFLPMTFTTACLRSDSCHFWTLKSFFYANVRKSVRVTSTPVVCVEGSGRGGRAATAATANKRGSAPGAVGLSFEKMQLVRQKKEEIEKVRH